MVDNKMTDKELYTLASLTYMEKFPGIPLENLFTNEWNISTNYKLKVLIIGEAIKKRIRVEETELYLKSFPAKKL